MTEQHSADREQDDNAELEAAISAAESVQDTVSDEAAGGGITGQTPDDGSVSESQRQAMLHSGTAEYYEIDDAAYIEELRDADAADAIDRSFTGARRREETEARSTADTDPVVASSAEDARDTETRSGSDGDRDVDIGLERVSPQRVDISDGSERTDSPGPDGQAILNQPDRTRTASSDDPEDGTADTEDKPDTIPGTTVTPTAPADPIQTDELTASDDDNSAGVATTGPLGPDPTEPVTDDQASLDGVAGTGDSISTGDEVSTPPTDPGEEVSTPPTDISAEETPGEEQEPDVPDEPNTGPTPSDPTPTNEAPEGLGFTATAVAENQAGASVGTVTATDPEGGALTWSVDDARFEV
ncbi:MAG: hypothetical protein AAF919_17760, partial [Pseudomonadota bacterium]